MGLYILLDFIASDKFEAFGTHFRFDLQESVGACEKVIHRAVHGACRYYFLLFREIEIFGVCDVGVVIELVLPFACDVLLFEFVVI